MDNSISQAVHTGRYNTLHYFSAMYQASEFVKLLMVRKIQNIIIKAFDQRATDISILIYVYIYSFKI